MFCPECKAEYRPGFTRCSDCDVDLVEELPEREAFSEGALALLWECAEQSECVGVCSDLKNADIPYKVDRSPYERTAGMGVQWHYRILISPSDLDRAKDVLGIDAPQRTIPTSDDEDEEVFDPVLELPDTSPSPINEPKRRDYVGFSVMWLANVLLAE